MRRCVYVWRSVRRRSVRWGSFGMRGLVIVLVGGMRRRIRGELVRRILLGIGILICVSAG